MPYSKSSTPHKTAQNRPKSRQKAEKRKIFIFLILACKNEKTTPFCVNDGRLRRSTASVVLTQERKSYKSAHLGRKERYATHSAPRG